MPGTSTPHSFRSTVLTVAIVIVTARSASASEIPITSTMCSAAASASKPIFRPSPFLVNRNDLTALKKPNRKVI